MTEAYVQRHRRIEAATAEGKERLLQSYDWAKMREHLQDWLMTKYFLSRTTIADDIKNVETRLKRDPEIRRLMVELDPDEVRNISL